MSQNEDVTSAGVPWSQVPEFARHQIEWMDGRHGPAQYQLPSIEVLPIPDILHKLPYLHERRPRGTKPMIDVAGAEARLRGLRPGAWLISPFTGWKWAKWPNGKIGWLPAEIQLPLGLRVPTRNDLQ